VSTENANAADEVATSFTAELAAWIDGSLGSPPFAPWLTAWASEPPTAIDEDRSGWPLWRVTRDELATGEPWNATR
jgi:hypothetical protein